MIDKVVTWSPALVAGVVAAGAVSLFVAALTFSGHPAFVDWYVYASGTERILDGKSLYLAEQVGGPYRLPDVTPAGYIQAPPSAILFLPFAVGQLGLIAWLVVSVGVFVSGLAAIVQRELGAVRPVALAIALFGLALAFPIPGGRLIAPFPDGLGNANANVLLAGLLAWCWATGDRRRWIPYAAGLAWTFKVFPAALALWAFRRDGWRAIVISAVVATAVIAVTLPIVGLEEWRRFVLALSNAQPTCDGGRTSIACLAIPYMDVGAAKAFGIVVGGVLLLLAVVVRSEFPAFVLLTIGMLAPMADGHAHYLLFLYVLVVIAAARWIARRGRLEIHGDDTSPSVAVGS